MCPQGLIFDFDGVMVDTEWAIFQSWVRLYAREGQQLSPADYAPCLGAGYSRWDPAAHLEQRTGRCYDWEQETRARRAAIDADLAEQGLMPGCRELLNAAHARGLRLAVASSSTRHWVEGWLRRLGIYEEFDAVFCRTDGYPVKPDPALFLAAQQCLALPKEECLIIEDSENGVLAAQRAGIPCAAVPCRLTEGGDFSSAALRCRSLHELLLHLG